MASNKTCAYCNNHVWHDYKLHHVCLLAGGDGGEMSVDGSCDRWKTTRHGTHGCLEHVNIIDMDVIEGKVKDDKYTRRK